MKFLRNVVTPEFLKIITDMGWRYVSKKGRGGSRFERLSQTGEAHTVAIEAVRGFGGPLSTQEPLGISNAVITPEDYHFWAYLTFCRKR